MRAVLLLASTLVLAGCGGGEDMKVPEPDVAKTIVVTSPAFGEGQVIPRQHTCQGAGRSPELGWRGVPDDAESLALVVSDPDAPSGTFVHWLLYDLPPRDGELTSGASPASAREGDNSAGRKGWYPPCPPSGTHRYEFTIYALGKPVSGRSAQGILDEIGRAAIASGTLTGLVRAS
jgi:Raf kinase inhibitor-like YbhB/YbcL family protein